MDIKDAKFFVYIPAVGDSIYISDDIDKLHKFAREDNYFCATCENRFIYALVEENEVETLFHVYFDEDKPSIKEKYIRWKYIGNIYKDREIVRI